MPIYKYKVLLKDGKEIEEEISGESREKVEEILLKRVDIDLIYYIKEKNVLFSFLFPDKKRKIKLSLTDFILLCQQFSVLLAGGVNIMKIFSVLNRSFRRNKKILYILDVVKERVKSGSRLSDAFALFPATFPLFFINMLKVGELSGTVDHIFWRLSVYYKKINEARKKLINSLIYPVFVLSTAFVLINFVIFFILPRFEKLFKGFINLSQLPLITRVLFNFGKLVRSHVILWFLLTAGVVIFLYLFFEKFNIRKNLEVILFKIPVIGELLRYYYSLVFLESMYLMMESGVVVVRALEMASKVLDSKLYQIKLQEAKKRISVGKSFAYTIIDLNILHPVAEQLILTGEESGMLPKMTKEALYFYEIEFNTLIDRLISLTEPILILTVGFIVAIILIALYLPIFVLPGKIH